MISKCICSKEDTDFQTEIEDIAYRLRGLGELLIFQSEADERFTIAGTLVCDQGEMLQLIVNKLSVRKHQQFEDDQKLSQVEHSSSS